MQLSICQFSALRGWSQAPDPALDSSQTLLIFFVAFDAEPFAAELEKLRSQFPQSLWTGCSTAGEIFGAAIGDHTLTLAILKFERTVLRIVSQEIAEAGHSVQAGAQLAADLAAPDLRAAFVLADGMFVNGSELVRGLMQALPRDVVVTGGMAGDGFRFLETRVIADRQLKPHAITAVGLYGDHIGVTHGSKSGWDVLGPEREVTKSSGNVLYALDGQPALELYKKYLGDRAKDLPVSGLSFPIAIKNAASGEEDTIRAIIAVDEAAQSITLGGDIPQGATVQLMRVNFEHLIDGAAQAAERVSLEGYDDGPLCCLVVSCSGRRMVLGERTEEELDAVRGMLPPNCQMVGFYSYGELSPLASGRCDLHNETMTLTLLWET